MTSATEATIEIAATTAERRRRATTGTRDPGGSAMPSVRSVYTRTGRAMFLTLCSPLDLGSAAHGVHNTREFR
jgi:hypothetical protein